MSLTGFRINIPEYITFRWNLWNWPRNIYHILWQIYSSIVLQHQVFPDSGREQKTPLFPKLMNPCLTLVWCGVNLPTLSKVLEHLVLNKLIIYINEEALLSPTVSGVWKSHLTITVLLGINDALIRASRGEVLYPLEMMWSWFLSRS